MSGVSNEMLYEQLIKQSGQIGALSADVTAFKSALETHFEDDKRLTDTVVKLKTAHDRQSGAIKILGILWTGLAAVGSTVLYRKHS